MTLTIINVLVSILVSVELILWIGWQTYFLKWVEWPHYNLDTGWTIHNADWSSDLTSIHSYSVMEINLHSLGMRAWDCSNTSPLRINWSYDGVCEYYTVFTAQQFNLKFPLYPFYFYACSPKDGPLTGHNRLLLSQVSPACFLYLWIGNGLKAPVLWRSQGQLPGYWMPDYVLTCFVRYWQNLFSSFAFSARVPLMDWLPIYRNVVHQTVRRDNGVFLWPVTVGNFSLAIQAIFVALLWRGETDEC